MGQMGRAPARLLKGLGLTMVRLLDHAVRVGWVGDSICFLVGLGLPVLGEGNLW